MDKKVRRLETDIVTAAEAENRIRNLMWTVSGDYKLDTKLDVESFFKSRFISLYDAVKQGGFAKYFNQNDMAMYLVKKIYYGAEEKRLNLSLQEAQDRLDRGAQLIAQIPLDQWRQVDTLRIHYTNAYLVYQEPTGTRPPYWLYLEGALWQEDPFHQVGDLSYTSSYQPPSPITFSDNLGNQYDFSGEWYVGYLDPQASEVYLDYDQFGRHYRLTIPLDWGDAP